MPPSPLQDIEGPLRVTVLSNGAEVTDRAGLVSLTVRRAVNRVPSATLVFADGDMPEQSFPLSDAADFVPGTEIELTAGYGDRQSTIFKGTVVRHGLRIDSENGARLVIECCDKAVRMTVGRKSAIFRDASDADIMRQLISDAGLTADVEPTTTVQPELIQHNCSDWDFVLARAEANGQLVWVKDGTVRVGAPLTSCNPVLAVAYGDSLISFQAELDAQDQDVGVQARGSDMGGKALTPSGAALNAGALDPWTKARQLKSGLSRLRGSMSFQGSPLAAVGALIELKGVGARFSGSVLVTALTHTIEAGGWTTQAEFGSAAGWLAERADIMVPPATGRLPGMRGLHVGQVVRLDGDPGQQHRIQVSIPTANIDRVWARLMQFHASSGFGAFFVPEVGDEVVLGWFDDDPNQPVVLGSLYSARNAPPQAVEAGNPVKALVSRCKASLTFDDENKTFTVRTPAGNVVVLSDKDKSITLIDQNGNQVALGSSGITLDSPGDILVSAKGRVSIDAVGALSLSSRADVEIAGLNVNAVAEVGLVAKGTASAELSAAGQTTVKGAMVMIN